MSDKARGETCALVWESSEEREPGVVPWRDVEEEWELGETSRGS